MSSETLTPPKVFLGPLNDAQRAAIMEVAPSLTAEGRRTFHRLLVLAQDRGLSQDVITRAAGQAREHAAR
jgi:hypothetical protein